jgi:hypothetical protein
VSADRHTYFSTQRATNATTFITANGSTIIPTNRPT